MISGFWETQTYKILGMFKLGGAFSAGWFAVKMHSEMQFLIV